MFFFYWIIHRKEQNELTERIWWNKEDDRYWEVEYNEAVDGKISSKESSRFENKETRRMMYFSFSLFFFWENQSIFVTWIENVTGIANFMNLQFHIWELLTFVFLKTFHLISIMGENRCHCWQTLFFFHFIIGR